MSAYTITDYMGVGDKTALNTSPSPFVGGKKLGSCCSSPTGWCTLANIILDQDGRQSGNEGGKLIFPPTCLSHPIVHPPVRSLGHNPFNGGATSLQQYVASSSIQCQRSYVLLGWALPGKSRFSLPSPCSVLYLAVLSLSLSLSLSNGSSMFRPKDTHGGRLYSGYAAEVFACSC